MRRISITLFAVLLSVCSFAQVGIGTTNPNTTLDVRGSLAANSRSFSTTSETVLSTDFALLFTGNSACTLALPDATGCIGRIIHVKNTKTGTVPVLTIITTASQTIDGLSSIVLNDPNESVNIVSDGSNWKIMGQSLPTGSGISWTQGGNTVGSIKKLGTLDSYDLPFITNNIERMRITSAGRVAIGTTSFDVTNPEKFLVDAGSTSSFNVISGKGTIDNYLQLNIQNKSGTGNASSDLVATADNGTESINYVDLGINSSAYTNTTYPIIGGANNVYLYGTGNDFAIGNGTSGKNLQFFTGGYALTNERMRITGAGNIGINNTSPSEKLQVDGNIRLSGTDRAIFFDATSDPYAGIKTVTRSNETTELMMFAGNDVAGAYGADRIRLASQEIHFATSSVGSSGINSGDPTSFYSNTTNVPTRMLIDEDGNVAIGTTSFDNNNPKLQIDAGTTSNTSLTPISVIGSTNNYVQLNVQNLANGNSASSDIVATANNGSASTVYIDMGINSAGYSTAAGNILNGSNTAYLYSTGGDLVIGNGAQNKDLIFFTNMGTTSADGTERMRIAGNGNVGIGTTSTSTYKLNVGGSVNASGGYTQVSDMRMKMNIQSLNYGLKEVMNLKPVSYNWKDPQHPENKIGFIAQEVRKVIPEVVSGDESKETIGMSYAELVPVLVNAIKEQQKEIEDLKQRVKALEHQ